MMNTFEGWVLLGVGMIAACSIFLVFTVGIYLEEIRDLLKQDTKEDGD